MPPATFNCTRCHAPLTPGTTRCANCGLIFDAPVPYAAAPNYAAPVKKSSPAGIIALVCAIGCLPMIAIFAAILYPVLAKARDKAWETSSRSNLMQVGLVCMQYEQDHNNKFPPMDSMEHFQAAVSQYAPPAGKYDIYTQTGVHVPYALNAELSNKSLDNISNPARVMVMHETVPHSDGKITTLYADGHTELKTPRQ